MPMKTIEGYSKEKYTDNSVLLAGGGAKALSDFIGSLTWDSTNKKIKYTPIGGSATDLVTLSWDNISGKPDSFTPASHDHDSVYAKLGAHNNLTAGGNEFTSAASGQSGDYYWNYRTAGGTNGNITSYILGDGKGGTLGTIIHSGNIGSQSVNYAASAGAVAWANITGKPSSYIPVSSIFACGGGSSSAPTYVKLCTITITSSYQNRPIVIEYGGRSFSITNTLYIQFGNTSSKDPALNKFYVHGLNNLVYIGKTATSTWVVYTHGMEGSWADVFIHRFNNNNGGITVTWAEAERIVSIPEGYTQATYGGNVAYAVSAGSVAWTNVSDRPTNLNQFTNGPGYITGQDHYKTTPGAGTAGTSTASSGSTLEVPYLNINANGHITGYGTHTHTISGFLTPASSNRQGVYKLYRRDDNSNYSVQTDWTGTYWRLRGYSGDTYHAGCQVAYADNAGTAASASSVAWSNVSGRPTNVSSFTNDSNYITSSALSPYLPIISGGSHSASGNGTAATTYCLIATIDSSGSYINYPITFELGGRGSIMSRVTLMFTNTNVADPDVSYFVTDNQTCYYLAKTATKTWKLYASSPSDGGWGVYYIYRIYGGRASAVTVEMTMVQTLPSGYIQPTYTGNVNYATSAGSATTAGSASYADSAGSASSATDADKVDGYHASDLVKFYLSPMTSDAPADSAKSWFTGTMPSSSGAIVYNVPGSEKTIIAGKSSGSYGHMLQLSYDDNYLRMLRYKAGSWQSTDWEKISAGAADTVKTVIYSPSSNVALYPTFVDSYNNTAAYESVYTYGITYYPYVNNFNVDNIKGTWVGNFGKVLAYYNKSITGTVSTSANTTTLSCADGFSGYIQKTGTGTYKVSLTNTSTNKQSGNYQTVQCVITPVYTDASYEMAMINFATYSTSVYKGNSCTWTFYTKRLHCQGSWSTSDFVQLIDNIGFTLIIFGYGTGWGVKRDDG